MADYMFPTDTAPLPAGLFDAFPADPGPFIEAMESGMQSFAAGFEGGGMAAAGDAFMTTMHNHIEAGDIPGMNQEAFDTFADAFTEIAGPGLMTMPADANAADVAEVFQTAGEAMMPEGMDMPPEMGDMFGNMANVCDGLDGCGPHELGGEFGPEMPEGFVAGDPSTLPEGDFAPPPPEMGTPPEDVVGDDAPPPPEMGTPPAGDGMNIMDDAAADVLGGAIGGEGADLDNAIGADAATAAADTAIGAAIDSATDQSLAEGQPDPATPVDAPDDVVVVEDVPEDDAAPEDVSPT
jgi:hypothetical protein